METWEEVAVKRKDGNQSWNNFLPDFPPTTMISRNHSYPENSDFRATTDSSFLLLLVLLEGPRELELCVSKRSWFG